MVRHNLLKILILAASILLLGFIGYRYLHGVPQQTSFIKPPAVKLVPSKGAVGRLNQLAKAAKGKLSTLFGGSADIKSLDMNPGVTVFFPSTVSMPQKSHEIVADIVRDVLAELGTGPVDIHPENVQWFGQEKQHILVVKHKPLGTLQDLRDRIEQKAKERGLLPQDYQAPPYNPHSSLVGITGADQERMNLEDKGLTAWQKASQLHQADKKAIPGDLTQLMGSQPFYFDTIVVYGSDFKPKAEFKLDK